MGFGWRESLDLLGAVGGLLGILATWKALRSDRPRLIIEIDNVLASKAFISADEYDDPNLEEPAEWSLVTIRNIGDRATTIEAFEQVYSESLTPGDPSMGKGRPTNITLDEGRRKYTHACYRWIHTMPLVGVIVKDDRGKLYYVPAPDRETVKAIRMLQHWVRFSDGLMHAEQRQIDERREQAKTQRTVLPWQELAGPETGYNRRKEAKLANAQSHLPKDNNDASEKDRAPQA